MIHAYHLVYPLSQHGSPPLWEYEGSLVISGVRKYLIF